MLKISKPLCVSVAMTVEAIRLELKNSFKKMAEETEEENKVVDDSFIPVVSSNKYGSCNIYTLKIPNLLILSEYKDKEFELKSPSFTYNNATWCFQFRSRKQPKTGFAMDIVRLNSEIPEHVIYFQLISLEAYNIKIDCESYVFKLSNSCQSGCLYIFMNDNFPHDGSDNLNFAVYLFDFDQAEVDVKQVLWTQDLPHNTALDSKECKIYLKSTMTNFFSKFFSLQLPNMCTTHERKTTKFSFCTEQFEFAKKNCYFYIHSFDAHKFAVDLIVMSYKRPLQKFFSKCTLIDNDGQKRVELRVPKNLQGFGNATIAHFNKNHGPKCTLLVHLLSEEDLTMDELVRARGCNLLSQDLKSLFLNGVDCDLTLKVAEKEFQVHRIILKARSPVFNSMLSHDMIEKNKGIIEVEDIDVETMQLLLSFIYSGEVDSLTLDNVFRAYYAADKYNITLLKKICTDFMKKSLSPLVICDVMQLAMKHNDENLLQCSANYFATHADDITSTDVWVSLMKEDEAVANEILARSKLCQITNS